MKICSKLTLNVNTLNLRGICGHIRTVFWLCTYVQCKHAMLITILPWRGALKSSIYFAICMYLRQIELTTIIYLTERLLKYQLSEKIMAYNFKTRSLIFPFGVLQ